MILPAILLPIRILPTIILPMISRQQTGSDKHSEHGSGASHAERIHELPARLMMAGLEAHHTERDGYCTDSAPDHPHSHR
jgi:hypothetical protein